MAVCRSMQVFSQSFYREIIFVFLARVETLEFPLRGGKAAELWDVYSKKAERTQGKKRRGDNVACLSPRERERYRERDRVRERVRERVFNRT